jgi:hypothetical protein
MELSDQAVKLLTTAGFDAEFFANLATCKTKKEAYEKTEALYQSFFKKRRYSCFDSYRVARDFRISQKR